MRISEAILWGEQELESVNVENPRWDTELMLSRALTYSRVQLYLESGQVLTALQEQDFKKMICRRMKREPLQYILNHQEFMGLGFYVDNRVLIPRADTEVLLEYFLEESKNWLPDSEGKPARVLDLCTGSGALAISVAHYWPEASVVATDISAEALEVACYNAQQLNVQVEWRQGDFLDPVEDETWDFIVTNPPYVPMEEYLGLSPEIFEEPKLAFLANHGGLDFYKRLANKAKTLLKPNGQIFLEIGWQQGKAVQEIFREKGFESKVVCDYGGRDRVVIVR